MGKKGLKGAVDLKSVQLLGNAYKEKVKYMGPSAAVGHLG